VHDAETFARRHPDLFLGGTFVAGLLLARFLKSSTPEWREREERGERGPWRPPYSGDDRDTAAGRGTERYGSPYAGAGRDGQAGQAGV
jgi:hypothetical protein